MAVAVGVQGGSGAAAQAQQAPAIPPLPTSPGAPTGATQAAPAPAAPGAVGQGQATQDQGTPQTVVIQPPPYRDVRGNREIPDQVIPIIGMLTGTLMAIVLGYPIIRLISRLIERRFDKAYIKGANIEAQLRSLQESVDTMAIEIERIGESQRFQAKVLAERKPGALPPG
jgi:hypothetical protein